MKKLFDDFETIELKNRELKLAKTLQANWLVNNIIPHDSKYRTGSIRGPTSIRSCTLIQYHNLGQFKQAEPNQAEPNDHS